MRNNLVLVLILALAGMQTASAEGVRITPKWLEENPGKLTLTSGSSFSGQTDYIAYLNADHAAIFEVWTKIQFVTDDKWTSPWIITKTRAGTPAKSVRFGDTSFGIYAASARTGEFRANVIYEVYEVSVETNRNGEDVWSRKLSYTLDRSDWTSLEIAAAQHER